MSTEIKIDVPYFLDALGDIDGLITNIELFITENYPDFSDKLNKSYKHHDITAIKVTAHTLKSSANYMACKAFADQCGVIESLAMKGLWDEIEKRWEDFIKNFEYLYELAKNIQTELILKRKQEDEIKEKQETEEKLNHFEANFETKKENFKDEPELKSKLSNFVNKDYKILRNDFTQNYNSKDYKEIVSCLEKFKSYSDIFGFENVSAKCLEAITYLKKFENLDKIPSFSENFLVMFENLYEICKEKNLQIIYDNQNSVTRLPLENLHNSSGIDSSRKSMSSCIPISASDIRFHEELYQKLNIIKFDGFYKKGLSPDIITDQLKKTLEGNEVNTNEVKSKGKTTKNEKKERIKDDYPFLHEKITCSIF